MTTKEATKIATTLAKGLTDAQVLAHPDFEIYTEKEKEMVLNAYRQATAEPAVADPKPVTSKKKAAKKEAAKKPAKKEATKKPAAEKKPAVKRNGTDAQLRERIIAGDTNAKALAFVLKHNKDAKTTLACASWNRSQLRNNWKKYGFTKNPNVPTDREAADKK